MEEERGREIEKQELIKMCTQEGFVYIQVGNSIPLR